MKNLVLADGKYEIVFSSKGEYPEKALRYGEEWRDLIGDNLIAELCHMIDELKANNE